MLEVAVEELPHTDVFGLVSWLETYPSLDKLLDCPNFYEEGREFEHKKDGWQVEPGMVVKTSIPVDTVSPPPNLVRFGEDGEIETDMSLSEFIFLLNKEATRSRSRSISH